MMAVGDAVLGGAYNVSSNGTTDIQPGAGVEWLIHTLASQSGKTMEVYYAANGTNLVLVDTLTGGSVHNLTWRVTNSQKMQLKNTSGGDAGNFYQGVVTK